MNNQQLLNRLDEVIVNSAVDTSPAEFLATHLPFKSLKYTSSGIGEDIEKSISEEDFFNEHLLKQADKHNLIIVQGDSGSGKSHFIRWLNEKYELNKDSNEVIVAIKRHQNSLKSAINQILQYEAFREINNQDLTNKLSAAKELLEDSELLYSIKNNLLTKLESNTLFTDCAISKRESDKLIEFMKCKLAFDCLLKDGPFKRIYQKISSNSNEQIESNFDARFTAEDFVISIDLMEDLTNSDEVTKSARNCAKDFYRKEDFRNRVAKYLNTYVDSVIQLCLQMSGEDFAQIIYELRKYLKSENKNLTIFIEDITTFTGIDKSLIEALNVTHQNNDEICRVFSVLGTTKSYYDSFFPDNLKQRVTGRVFIYVESVFGTNEDVVLMAARYLNAINTSGEQLNYWLESGAQLKKLPIADLYSQHTWSKFEDPLLGEIPLFPFNKRAIIHLYRTLDEKTPRVFLKQVIKHVYKEYLDHPESFPGTWQDFKNYYDIPQWAEELHKTLIDNQAHEKSDELSCVLRVWGDRTAFRTIVNGETRVGDLPKEVFEVFSVPFIQGKEKDTMEPAPGRPTTTTITPPITTKPDVGREPVKEQVLTKYDKEMKVLRDWYEQQQPLSIHKDLRAEISSFLQDFIQWQNYGISNFLANNFFGSGSFSRISIEGQTVEINELGIVLRRNNTDYQFLRAILSYKHLGGKTWVFSNSTDHLLLVYNWIAQNIDSIIERITNTVEYPEWNMVKWAVYNQYMICIINGQITGQESAEEIYLKIMNTTKLNGESDHSDSWKHLLTTIKEDLITNNVEFMRKNANILLGEASADTNKYFIDAETILKEIDVLVKNNWVIHKLPEVHPVKSQVYVSYQLLKEMRRIIPTLSELEVHEFQKVVKDIQKYVQNDEIEQSIYKINSFLLQTLSGKAQEFYSQDDFKLALTSDEEIDSFAQNVKNIIRKIGLDYKNNKDCLIEISKFSINTIKDYLLILLKTDQILDRLTKKYNQSIVDNQLGIKEYEASLLELKENINKVNKSLNLLGVSDNHVITKN